jgi:hypothetical protein
MIKIRITWPLLIVLALALFAWLIRDSGASRPRPARRPSPRPDRPERRRRASVVIDQDGPDAAYDAETERLDGEAFATGQRAYEAARQHHQETLERMKYRHEQRAARYAAR